MILGDKIINDDNGKENLMITANSQTPFLQSSPMSKTPTSNGMKSSDKKNSKQSEDVGVGTNDTSSLHKSKGKRLRL